jgi:hypothetical protein
LKFFLELCKCRTHVARTFLTTTGAHYDRKEDLAKQSRATATPIHWTYNDDMPESAELYVFLDLRDQGQKYTPEGKKYILGCTTLKWFLLHWPCGNTVRHYHQYKMRVLLVMHKAWKAYALHHAD